jgi:integrase/recombinase XerD
VQSKGRKDRNVMLPVDILSLLRDWWKERPTCQDKDVPNPERVLFPGYRGKPRCTLCAILSRPICWKVASISASFITWQLIRSINERAGASGPCQTDDHGTLCQRGHRHDRGGG